VVATANRVVTSRCITARKNILSAGRVFGHESSDQFTPSASIGRSRKFWLVSPEIRVHIDGSEGNNNTMYQVLPDPRRFCRHQTSASARHESQAIPQSRRRSFWKTLDTATQHWWVIRVLMAALMP
jgi:hypothetical protein